MCAELAPTSAEHPDVLIAVSDGALHALVAESLHTMLPTARVGRLEPGALRSRRIPGAACVVVGPTFGEYSGLEACRALRAGGFEREIVCVVDDESSTSAPGAARIGVAHTVTRGNVVAQLPVLVATIVGAAPDSPMRRELRHSQGLMAIGELALGLQHSLNNPLTALMAEAQLLAMEPLAPDHLAAVERMVELCRRVAAVVRRLDVVSTRKPGEGGGGAAVGSEPATGLETARTSQL
jgi:signal transduction histidine kinase